MPTTTDFLSATYFAPITIKSQVYPSAAHYIHSQKFTSNPAIQSRIRLAETGEMAAKIAQDQAFYCRSDWSKVEEKVIRKALDAKFTQHPILRDQLLATGTEFLDEQGNGIPARYLMDIRAQIQRETVMASRNATFQRSISVM
ncbi:hypothetical protein DFS34DRAFT_577889 [Phlyctochytrium arcticum]|nr:hypothetical protein DFS34DRAFT_577889 [Phlyctochytrium arcticum]